MVDSSTGSMFSSAAGIFLSFHHAARERLVYFIVSKQSVLINSLFYEMTQFKFA